MVSPSTRTNFNSHKTQCNSLVSKSACPPLLYHRCSLVVWPGKSGGIHILPRHYDGSDLLQPSTKFTWTTEHRIQADHQINQGVEIFEKDRPTCIATDWSKIGIGYWMFQKHCACPTRELFCCNDGWRITLVGSRFTHAAESRYAAIEGEALAVAEALEKCRHFILGCRELYVAVDHKPLVKIFGDRALADITSS